MLAGSPLQPVATLGIDIGKNSIHLIGLDARGAIVLRQKLSRGQVEARQDGNHPTAPTAVKAALPGGQARFAVLPRSSAGRV